MEEIKWIQNSQRNNVITTRDDLALMRSHTTYRMKLLVMKTISKLLIVRQPT